MTYNPNASSDHGSLLLDLHSAHENVLSGMEELGRLTRNDRLDERLLAAARWRLSQASMRRRLLWARILGHMMPKIDQGTRDELLRLQKLDIELLGASTRHIRKWTTEAIAADWPKYCAASREMRWKMIAEIEEEKRVLYPLLRAQSAQENQLPVGCALAR